MAWRGWRPRTSTAPLVGRESPSTMSMVVVLPAPFGPRKATISPGWISRSMPRTACTSPKSLVTPPRRTAGMLCVSMTASLLHPGPAVAGGLSRPAHDTCHPGDRAWGHEGGHPASGLGLICIGNLCKYGSVTPTDALADELLRSAV